ncbi:MAG: hypothetical protein Q8P95_02075, partial [bacterium]|nr:hypothetical protein [bacterium]
IGKIIQHPDYQLNSSIFYQEDVGENEVIPPELQDSFTQIFRPTDSQSHNQGSISYPLSFTFPQDSPHPESLYFIPINSHSEILLEYSAHSGILKLSTTNPEISTSQKIITSRSIPLLSLTLPAGKGTLILESRKISLEENFQESFSYSALKNAALERPSEGNIESTNIIFLSEILEEHSKAILMAELRPDDGEAKFIQTVNHQPVFAESFENGLWNSTVYDCTNKMPGAPVMAQNLSWDASEGEKSLQLQSKNHFACTHRSFPFEGLPYRLYKLSLQYKLTKGSHASLGYTLEKEGRAYKNIELSFSGSGPKWQYYETIVEFDENTDIFNLSLYAPSDGEEEIIVNYDNIKLEDYAPKSLQNYYLYDESERSVKPLVKTVAKKINPTKYRLKIHSATENFLQVLSESFNNRWKVYPQYVNNNSLPSGPLWETWFQEPLPEENHLMVNGYANSWWIDVDEICKKQNKCIQNPDGSYDLELVIEFWPQRLFYIGLAISGTTLLLILTYLSLSAIRNRRKNLV